MQLSVHRFLQFEIRLRLNYGKCFQIHQNWSIWICGCLHLNNSLDSTIYTESMNPVSVLPGYQVSEYARFLSAVFDHSKWLPNLGKHVESPKIQRH